MNSEKECVKVALLEEPETLRGHVADGAASLAAKTAVQTAIVDGTTGALAGLSNSILGLPSVALATTASILINQTHYQNKRAGLREMYKNEVAAQLGKSPDKIRDKDIDLIAKGDAKRGIVANKTIAEELQCLKKRRNVGMLVTGLTILATVAIVINLPGIAAAAGAGAAASGFGAIAGRMLLGFAIHKVLENPMKKAGKKLFKLEAPTTHDRIAELNKQHRKGKTISREQTLAVFVSANKDLSQFVIDNYGMHYDKLSVQDKHVVVEAMEQHIPITSITKNLNSGSVKISELAFSVEGKISGVAPNTLKNNISLVGKARHALMNVGTRLQNVAHRHNAVAAVSSSQKNSAIKHQTAMEYNNPTPARSFVERYHNEKAADVSRYIH
jgi:hypothetical protein